MVSRRGIEPTARPVTFAIIGLLPSGRQVAYGSPAAGRKRLRRHSVLNAYTPPVASRGINSSRAVIVWVAWTALPRIFARRPSILLRSLL